jgi:hypothetical protein
MHYIKNIFSNIGKGKLPNLISGVCTPAGVVGAAKSGNKTPFYVKAAASRRNFKMAVVRIV